MKLTLQLFLLAGAIFHFSQTTGAQEVLHHWIVQTESSDSAQVVDPAKAYRLVTGGGQLVPTSGNQVVKLARVASARKNVKIQRVVHDPNYGDVPNAGIFVKTREPIAVLMEGAGYLVYKGGGSLGLSFDRDPPPYRPQNHPGKYQWEPRPVPKPNVRDHRPPREIKTKEELALYNKIAKKFLIYSPQDPKLRWLEE
jgi:hypothetical protein